ncbi:MAG: GMC family oxidoreductase [Marinosulfonomonas sp.]
MTRDADYIIVGGGSAGAVIAAQLVTGLGAKVLVLETGPRRAPWLLDVPAGYMKFLASDRYLEFYESVPQPQLGWRSVIVPQGRILGGGSAVNAMVYIRGQAEDYDAWATAAGSADWSYDAMLPHFKAVEGNAELGAPLHGTDGPLKVSHLGHHCDVSKAFIEACTAAGIPRNEDFNGQSQAGVGFMQHTIDATRRKRSSTATAFLKPIAKAPNLTVRTGATVRRLLVDKGRVQGVVYHVDGQEQTAMAGTEVIVTAGALATPALLMRSGIGPADHLKDCGIAPVLDQPAIGQNLQDHCEVPLVAGLKKGLGYFGQDRGLAMIRNGVQYLLNKSGLATTTGVEACAFVDSDGSGRPDLQVYCVPTVYLDRTVTGANPTWGVTLTTCLLRPKSRGSVRLDPANPDGPLKFDPGFLRDADDLNRIVNGLDIGRNLLRQGPLANLVTHEIFPEAQEESRDQLEHHVRQTVKTNYHPVGTVAMGTAVDARLRLEGLEGLRVADASVMPTIPSGNTNAPTIALAHKAAEMIAQDAG